MKKKLVILGIIAILVTVGLSGCTNDPLDAERNKFVGSWKSPTLENDSFTCLSDKTFTAQAILFTGNGTWEIKDNKFILSFVGSQLLLEFNYFFINNHKTLTLTPVNNSVDSSQSWIYIKQ